MSWGHLEKGRGGADPGVEGGIQGADRPPKSAEPTEEGWRRRVPAGLTCSPVGWLAYSSQVSLFQQLQVAPGWEFALSLKIALYIRPTVCDLLVIQANRSQKISDSLEKFDFSVCFWQFFGLPPPYFCPYRSSLIYYLFKERLERFAPVALYKEWPLAIRSGLSWQKSNGSDSLGSFMTKSNGSESVFFMSESLFGSQKTANRSKS